MPHKEEAAGRDTAATPQNARQHDNTRPQRAQGSLAEQAEDIKRKHLYGDGEALGEAWLEARKEAEHHRGTPLQARFDMAVEIARLKFDLSAFMRRGEINSERFDYYVATLALLHERVRVLESVYAHSAEPPKLNCGEG